MKNISKNIRIQHLPTTLFAEANMLTSIRFIYPLFIVLLLICSYVAPVSVYAQGSEEHWTLPKERIWVPWKEGKRIGFEFTYLKHDLDDMAKADVIKKLKSLDSSLDDLIWLLDYENQHGLQWNSDVEIYTLLYNKKSGMISELGDYLVNAVWATPDATLRDTTAFRVWLTGHPAVFNLKNAIGVLENGKTKYVLKSELPGIKVDKNAQRILSECVRILNIKRNRASNLTSSLEFVEKGPDLTALDKDYLERKARVMAGLEVNSIRKCDRCKGFGREGKWRSEDCASCGGSGGDPGDLLGICRACGGGGDKIVVIESKACGKCGSDGKVRVELANIEPIDWPKYLDSLKFGRVIYSKKRYEEMSYHQKLFISIGIIEEAPHYKVVDRDTWLKQSDFRIYMYNAKKLKDKIEDGKIPCSKRRDLIHTVKSGESLRNIANQYYKAGRKLRWDGWSIISNANKDHIKDQTDSNYKLKPGTKLVIPHTWESSNSCELKHCDK